jgi:hypothetical protein
MLTAMKTRLVCLAGQETSPDVLHPDIKLDGQDADDSTVEGTSSSPDTEEDEEQEWQETSCSTEASLRTPGKCKGAAPCDVAKVQLSLLRSDWCAEADLGIIQGFENVASISALLNAQVARHIPGRPEPWLQGQCEERYWQLGARKPQGRYVAVSLGFDDKSLISLSEVTDARLFDTCVTGNFMKERVKLIFYPVKVKVPIPSKSPANADTVGTFFDKKAYGTFRSQLPCGADVFSIRVDVFSKWMVKMAVKQCGFRLGNTVEFSLVDWQNRASLASIRILVTDDFMKSTA